MNNTASAYPALVSAAQAAIATDAPLVLQQDMFYLVDLYCAGDRPATLRALRSLARMWWTEPCAREVWVAL